MYLERRKRAMRIAPFRRPLQNQSFSTHSDVVRKLLFREFHLEHAFKALFVQFCDFCDSAPERALRNVKIQQGFTLFRAWGRRGVSVSETTVLPILFMLFYGSGSRTTSKSLENDWSYRGPRKDAIRIARLRRSKYIRKTLLILMHFAGRGCSDPAICLYKTC